MQYDPANLYWASMVGHDPLLSNEFNWIKIIGKNSFQFFGALLDQKWLIIMKMIKEI